jgi:ATP-dependent Clp protease ATP-binding subunit ClpA
MGLLDAGREVRTIKALLTGAEREALRGGDGMPGPEHLLVSAVELADGTAARALGRFGVDAASLRAVFEQVHADALAGVGVRVPDPVDEADGERSSGPAPGIFRSTPQAQRVFQDAVALSKSTVPSRLLGAHVVAAVCGLEHGTAARVLAALGLDRGRLREAALKEARDAGQETRR